MRLKCSSHEPEVEETTNPKKKTTKPSSDIFSRKRKRDEDDDYNSDQPCITVKEESPVKSKKRQSNANQIESDSDNDKENKIEMKVQAMVHSPPTTPSKKAKQRSVNSLPGGALSRSKKKINVKAKLREDMDAIEVIDMEETKGINVKIKDSSWSTTGKQKQLAFEDNLKKTSNAGGYGKVGDGAVTCKTRSTKSNNRKESNAVQAEKPKIRVRKDSKLKLKTKSSKDDSEVDEVQITPLKSKRRASSTSSDFCPICQVPLIILPISAASHTATCSVSEGCEECPDGRLCLNTNMVHYQNFSHGELAAFRAYEDYVESDVIFQKGKPKHTPLRTSSGKKRLTKSPSPARKVRKASQTHKPRSSLRKNKQLLSEKEQKDNEEEQMQDNSYDITNDSAKSNNDFKPRRTTRSKRLSQGQPPLSSLQAVLLLTVMLAHAPCHGASSAFCQGNVIPANICCRCLDLGQLAHRGG